VFSGGLKRIHSGGVKLIHSGSEEPRAAVIAMDCGELLILWGYTVAAAA